MKKTHSFAVAMAVGGMLGGSMAPAMAGIDVEVSIGVPGVYVQPAPVYAEPAPVYVQPRPVYMQPYPVYVQPQPIYVQPRPTYVYPRVVYDNGRGHRGWHHHHRRHQHRDFDRDGVPNFRDGDRDGDGVSNRHDRRPNDGYRY